MRLIVNENISKSVIDTLRECGCDVLSVKESLSGSSDSEILARAQLDSRIVVTQDKDFGELAFGARLPANSGVILFRLSGAGPEHDNRRMIEVLRSPIVWEGQFAVATSDRIRLRPLPRE